MPYYIEAKDDEGKKVILKIYEHHQNVDRIEEISEEEMNEEIQKEKDQNG